MRVAIREYENFRLSNLDRLMISGATTAANSTENLEKTLRVKVLAEPFPGTVAQGDVLVFTKELGRL
jgi:hypothetical protein